MHDTYDAAGMPPAFAQTCRARPWLTAALSASLLARENPVPPYSDDVIIR